MAQCPWIAAVIVATGMVVMRSVVMRVVVGVGVCRGCSVRVKYVVDPQEGHSRLNGRRETARYYRSGFDYAGYSHLSD
jgi:hypothetical protein